MIFSFETEISVVAIQRIHQNSKKWWLLWYLLSENDLEAVVANFYCYGANVSEVVWKIAADQKDYHKYSLRVIVCWIAKMYQEMTVKKGWLLETSSM